MSVVRPRRSALYMPASNARAVEKARTLPCDVVILDLEDAVAPEMKPEARAAAVAAVKAGGFGRREVVIRVNGLSTRAPAPIPPRAAPPGLGQLERVSGPRLIFPPDGATVIADRFGPAGRGFVLAAGGDHVIWYVDGAPVTADPASGRPIWRPSGPGFYRLTVIDAAGRSAESHVRVTGG